MKVYITGTGLMSSLGNSRQEAFENLKNGTCHIQVIPDWQLKRGLKSHVGAPVRPYPADQFPRQVSRAMSPMSEMAALAALQALKEAGLDLNTVPFKKRSFILGSTDGSPATMMEHFKRYVERNGPEGQLATTFFKVMSHTVQANVVAALGVSGAAIGNSSACSSASQAIALGWELIKSGLYDVVVAGAADELHETGAGVFDVVGAATRKNDTPKKSVRPWDRERQGLAVSEGAAVVILECEESVKRRGAKPLMEVLSGVYYCDGTHMTQSQAPAMVECMNWALERAKVNPQDVGYVNAHATGTVQGDAEEARALDKMFSHRPPISSFKGQFGHSLAACGALEAMLMINMFDEQVTVPTYGLAEVADDCKGPNLLPEKTGVQKTKLDVIVSNNFAFGGMCSSLVLGKINEEEVLCKQP
jgi:3-oxoacyl-[acyl-carrier-protein] synthase II